MEDYTNPEITEEENLEEELSFSDKIVGVFSEPKTTFESIAKFDLKFTDWFLPLIIVAILAISSQYILMLSPEIKHELITKQKDAIQEQFDEAIRKGDITQEQVDRQMDIMDEHIGSTNPLFMVIGLISGIIFFFIVFFVIATFYFILAKFILKGDGSYTGAMIAASMPMFINLVQLILIIIVSLAMGVYIKGFSIATLIGMDNTTVTGFLLSRFEIFSIFGYVVTGIALAKLFKSESVTKYVISVLASWLIFTSIIFYLAQSFKFLQNMI